MGEAGLGTKRKHCEPVFDGVGLPATPTIPIFAFLFLFILLSLSVFIFQQQQKEMKNWDMGGMYKNENEWPWVAKFWVLEEQRKFGSCERSRSFSQGWFGKKNVKNGEYYRNVEKFLVARIIIIFLFKLFQVLAI